MAIRSQAAAGEIFHLKITLDYSEPPIWRRVEATGTTSLEDLHHIIQYAMGWEHSHMHEFAIGRKRIGSPTEESFGPTLAPPGNDGEDVQIARLGLRPKGKFTYTYDFGDSWVHILLVEKISHREPNTRYPRCTDGERACPPEDCGGIWGYANMLKALANNEHPDHEDMLEWIGPDFDAEAFDLDQVNQRLKHLSEAEIR